jgi:hypothetical protein
MNEIYCFDELLVSSGEQEASPCPGKFFLGELTEIFKRKNVIFFRLDNVSSFNHQSKLNLDLYPPNSFDPLTLTIPCCPRFPSGGS